MYEITPPHDLRTIPPKKWRKHISNKEHEFQSMPNVHQRWNVMPSTILYSEDYGITWKLLDKHPKFLDDHYWRFAFIDS